MRLRQLFSITEHVTTFSARVGRRRNNVCYVIYFLKGGVIFDCFTIALCSTLWLVCHPHALPFCNRMQNLINRDLLTLAAHAVWFYLQFFWARYHIFFRYGWPLWRLAFTTLHWSLLLRRQFGFTYSSFGFVRTFSFVMVGHCDVLHLRHFIKRSK